MKVELHIIIILFLALRLVINRQIFRLIKEFNNIVSTQIYADSVVKNTEMPDSKHALFLAAIHIHQRTKALQSIRAI